MKKKIVFGNFQKKYLIYCTSTIMITMISLSLSVKASDIDIYQKPTAGKITLMLMLDLSGSMTMTQGSVGSSACDVPSNFTVNSITTSDAATTSRPYIKNYCSVSGRLFYYMRSGTDQNFSYFKCGTNGSVRVDDCTEKLEAEPANLSSFSTTGTNPVYYLSDGPHKYFDRLTRLKDGLYDLLQGNQANNITAISNDKVIGLSVYSSDGNGRTGHIVVPARALNENVNGITQRQLLLNSIANMTAVGGTPTTNAYAEVASYLLGTTTIDSADRTIHPYLFVQNINGNYHRCMLWNSSGCADWGLNYGSFNSSMIQGLIGGDADVPGPDAGWNGTFYSQFSTNGYSGFNLSSADSKKTNLTSYNSPLTLINDDEQKKCYGQGIYVLTDGEPNSSSSQFAQNLMQQALGSSYASALTCSGTLFKETSGQTGWSCVSDMSQLLLGRSIDGNIINSKTNPLGLSIKTAVVGFGSEFNGMVSYNKNLSPAVNVENIKKNSNVSDNVRNTALWGVYGQGGWYSGSNSADVVSSVNSFIDNLSVEIPAVTTGTATIPVDKLNPYILQNNAYYPQFQPTPDKNYQLWAGNLKKYSVSSAGRLLGMDNAPITNTSGQILDNYDFWSKDTDQGTAASRLVGGVKAQLKLRSLDGGNTVQRKILTNRDFTQSDHVSKSNTLNPITLTYLTDTQTKDDPDRGYLMSLLGYAVDATQPSLITKTTLQNAAELRQVGAVMHSSPLLVTNSGVVTYDENEVGSKNRKDYVLFGTTQGLLHVVDASTGQEKFAFLPNEMIENQKQAFVSNDSTSGGINSLYYGIDAPWTSYTKYVLADGDVNTVGQGLNNSVGAQIVYGGLRMGGKSYYALDLADIDNPKLKFQINPQGSCSNTNPLGCMGQSWSKPSIGWVNWKGTRKLVMFVGGGYDAEGDGPDADKNNNKYKGYEFDDYQQTSKKGAGVYMFDALTGDLLWWASANATTGITDNIVGTYDENLKYSVVSEIKTVDRTTDGLIDHLYFGDLGGQVWRIDLNNATTNSLLFAKTPVRLLNLHQDGSSPRFYEMPSFSTYVNNGKIMAVLSIGSGNRSTPLAEYTSSTTNYNNDAIYNIYDKDVVRSDLFNLKDDSYTIEVKNNNLETHDISLLKTENSLAPTTLINQLFPITDNIRFSKDTIYATYENTQGWYYLYKGNKIQSQKVLTTPIVINGDLYSTIFDSAKPGTQGSCGAGVKGQSTMSLFCMPFGQCKSGTVASMTLDLGAGIVSGGIGNAGDGTRLMVANVDTSSITGNQILSNRYSVAPTLTPQRWYEKYQ